MTIARTNRRAKKKIGCVGVRLPHSPMQYCRLHGPVCRAESEKNAVFFLFDTACSHSRHTRVFSSIVLFTRNIFAECRCYAFVTLNRKDGMSKKNQQQKKTRQEIGIVDSTLTSEVIKWKLSTKTKDEWNAQNLMIWSYCIMKTNTWIELVKHIFSDWKLIFIFLFLILFLLSLYFVFVFCHLTILGGLRNTKQTGGKRRNTTIASYTRLGWGTSDRTWKKMQTPLQNELFFEQHQQQQRQKKATKRNPTKN